MQHYIWLMGVAMTTSMGVAMTTSNDDRSTATTPPTSLAEAATKWWTKSVADFWGTPTLANQAFDYWVDAGQRSVLFWDVMRKRGNQAIEHYEKGKPPVLVFDSEVVMDGRELDRPTNYMLLRIVPPEGVEIDQTKRPFVIIDPRAGHGPGIGGMKE